MATDYISRAGMMRHIEREAQKWGEDYDAMQILGDIEDFPAADVRPVVRGEWKKAYADHEAFGVRPFYRYCSKCHEASVHQYNFCPNCGADMREVKTDG